MSLDRGHGGPHHGGIVTSHADVPSTIRSSWIGDRVRLRPMHLGDVDLLLAEEGEDAEAVHFLNYGATLPKSRHDIEAFAQRFAGFGGREERVMWMIETLAGECVGGINLHSMDQKNGTFQTGTRIYRAHRRLGYGLEAKIMVLRYAFHELRYQKYEVRCLATNAPMVRHMARLGALQEGRLRRHVFTLGGYVDELVFGLTREEFDARFERGDRAEPAA
jgi:RimJ/RimL family protein N-acetyltransferase